LIVDKDKDVPVKEDRSTKRILKTLLISTHKGATSKHYIKSYAPACMHNNIAKPYDKF
jgi:hypothetical protein